MSRTPVVLKPVAGFCIKSSTLQPALYAPASINPNVLGLQPIPVPVGFKIFVNIAWDPRVPAPPARSEDAIQRAMKGEDADEHDPNGWYVPVIISEGRQEKDKAGMPSLVFDCIYNTSVKSRTFVDPEFKLFIVELALQRLEAQTSLVLSRKISTLNIASKGKLSPRTVFVPSSLASTPNLSAGQTATPLIQEIPPDTLPTVPALPRATAAPERENALRVNPSRPPTSPNSNYSRPVWTWSKVEGRLQIVITVPSLPRSTIAKATLDLEPKRLIFHIPNHPPLDVNLDLSDAEIVSAAASAISAVGLHGTTDETQREPNNTLTLKRQRDLDIDRATAEWRIAESTLIVEA